MRNTISNLLTPKGRWLIATLTLIFTLSIGQMWADTTYKLFCGATADVDGTNLNTADFWTGGTVSDGSNSDTYSKCVKLTSNVTGVTSIASSKNFIAYDVKTTATTIQVVMYNKNNSDKKVYFFDVKEKITSGKATASYKDETIKSKTKDVSKSYSSTNDGKATIYITSAAASDAEIYQVIVTETGTPLTDLKAGYAGYSLNLNKGRAAAKTGEESVIDGLTIVPSSDYKPTNNSEFKLKTFGTHYISFTAKEDCALKLTVTSGVKYTLGSAKNVAGSVEYGGAAGTYTTVLEKDNTYFINPIAGNESDFKITKIEFVPVYTLNFLPGEGTGSMEAKKYVEDAEVTLPECTFTYPGGTKEFASWQVKDEDDDDVTVTAGKFTMPDKDVNATALWAAAEEKYTVTYKDGETTLKSVNVAVGSAPDAYSPTKDCYSFAAWQKDASDYNPANLASDAEANQTYTLTARWTPVYASGTYNFEGKSVTTSTTEASVVDGALYFSAVSATLDTGDPLYYGWKLKTLGATVKFLVQNNSVVKVTLKEKSPLNVTYTPLEGAETTEAAAKSATKTVNVKGGTIVTLTTTTDATTTLNKIEILPLYTATRVDGKSDGAGSDANVLETTLPTPTAVSGWTFTGWTANEDVKAGEDTKTAGTVLAAGTYTLLANTTFTAQWAEATATYDVTYVSVHGTAPDAENAASVVLAELNAEGWAHKGWTANADVTVDAATVEAGTLIANGKTAILESNVIFTAVWKEIFTVTFDSKDGSAVAPVDVEDGATLAAAPEDPTKDNYVFLGWSETDGGDVVADITAITISANKTFFAKWALDVQVSEIVFSNSFKGWIHDGQVEVFYMAGESAPTITSYDGKNLKAEGGVVISGDKIIATGTDDSEKEFALTMTAVTPLTATGAQTFDGTEGYVKTRHAWTSDRKWKMSRHATDGRVARGETSMYIFLGAAESVTLDWGAQKVTEDVAVYVNGTFVKNIGKNNNSAIALSNGNNMVAMYSLQTSGDIWLNGLTVTPWVPVTAVALKEGEDPISSKEIYAGANFTLTAEVTPDNASNKTITWTSSDDAIATVVNGVVTGVAANATPVTITASTVDGVNATCVVTVTTAPEPSADPVITAQPSSANYYEGATIAALEVVATGESLTYQWYLGSDAIDGATAATYQPTVSAIGSYVYHCVVTNTEVGNLPTSLATDNATITISEDPAAIKLINKSTGAINTTNFITGVTANDNVHGENGAIFGSSSSNASVKGLSGLNKVVVYNATTTQTKIKLVLYNTNSAAQEVVLSTMAEGDVDPVGQAISVPSKELYSTGYITYNSTKNRTFYLHTKSTNVQISQIQVIESGNELAVAGKKDYSLNLNKGRVYAYASTAQTWEGLSMNLGSNYSPATTEYITFKDNALSFSVPNDVCLTITPARAGDKYYVTDVADGTDNATTTVAGTPNSFDLTGGVGKVWYIRSQGSNVQLTNIAFAAPKCEKPTITTQPATNHTFNPGDMTATVVATVSEGTLHYQWYKKATVGDDEEVGTDAATLTTTTEGTYYVVVTNVLAGHQNTSVTSDEAELGYRVTNDATLMALSYGTPATAIALEDGVYTYNVELAKGTTDVPALAATATMAGYATVTISNATEFVSYAASSTVTVKSEDLTVTKVYTVNFAVKHDLPQVDVTASTTWNWANAATTLQTIKPETKDVEQLMANIDDEGKKLKNDDEFNSQALLFKGQEALVKEGERWFAKGGHIKFNVTVPGKVTVEFSDNGNNNRRLKINDAVSTDASSSKTDVKTYSAYVEPGEVTLMGVKNDGTGVDQYIRISKIEFTAADESRANLQLGGIGTVCLPFDVATTDRFGGTFYKADYQGPGFAYFLEETGTLEAGKPYVYVADTTFIVLLQDANANTVNDPIPDRGMYGTFTDMAAGSLTGKYVIAQKKLRLCGTGATLAPYRAYIDLDEMPTTPLEVNDPANAPVRRRLGIGGNNGSTTDLQNYFEFDAEGTQKVIMNGQLYILRDGKMYNAQGQLMK